MHITATIRRTLAQIFVFQDAPKMPTPASAQNVQAKATPKEIAAARHWRRVP